MPRKMWRKRFDIDCNQISPTAGPLGSGEIDVKETRDTKYAQGSGPAYRQTRYRHCHDSPDRQYDDHLLLTDDQDNPLACYPQNINRTTIKSGSGPHYQATRLRYCNLQDSKDKREIREQELALAGQDPNPNQDPNIPSGDPRMRVERIKKAMLQSGTGPQFQKKRLARLCNDEDQLNNNDNTEDLEPNTAPGY